MKFLYKLFRQDPDSRDGIVMTTSILGVIVNILLAGLKVVFGLAVSSIAVVSEGINNAADSASSILTIVGTKLSRKKPTKSHPFGFGRIEYLTSLIISVLIVITGVEFLISSIKLIFHPADLRISYGTLLIIICSAVVKLVLGLYTIRMGRKASSEALAAVGTDCRNDSIISAVTILSALVFIIWGVSVDAYAGVIMSFFILKAGLDVLLSTLSSILGQPAEKEFADKLYHEIRTAPGVLNAADMMLHNYGPDTYSGSVNIEIDHSRTIGEIYSVIHELQLRIMHEYGVTMVFGIYAVDKDHADHLRIRKIASEFVKEHDHVVSFHALYIPKEEKKIYCDLVVDYELKSWDRLRSEFSDLMKKAYPDYQLELVLETEYV